MKKLLAGIAALSLLITSPGVANSQEVTEFEHQDNRYYSQTLNSRGVSYYRYKIPAYTFGVFTLKNHSRKSDFDIYVYDSTDGRLLNKGRNSGTQTELIVTPISGEDKYAYIKIVNYGSRSSQYHIFANYVSPVNKFFIALAQYPLCNPQENTADRTSSRVVTGISSILQKNDLGGVAKDLFINEVTAEMRKQFGYGCTGEFIVNFSVSIVTGFYRNY